MKRHFVTSPIDLNLRIPHCTGRADENGVAGAKSRDPADQIATKCLRDRFARGKHLVLGNDGRFRAYRGGAWHLLSDDALKKEFYTVLDKIPGLKCHRIARTLEDALELAKAKCAIPGIDPFRLTRTPRNIINLRNGELWLSKSGKATLKHHRSSSYQTHRLNFRYDPDAECPTYDRALRQIFSCAQDPTGLVKFWNEFLGYLVSTDRSQKIIAIMSGTGDNGKTALANLICTMVGEDLAANFDIEKLGKSQFMMASLIGKRILVDDDVSSDALLPDGELKKISEVKRLTAERKYLDAVEFDCRAVPLLLCNNVPRLDDLSKGMCERLTVIPFERRFTAEEKDPKIFEKIIEEELPGVLNRALQGYRRLRKRGRFAFPRDIRKARRTLIKRANPVAAFIDEHCERQVGKSAPLKELNKAFAAFLQESGASPRSMRQLSHALDNLGFKRKKTSTGVTYLGIGLK